PFAVTQPSITAGNGSVRPQGPTGELGGAVINLKYTPVEGAPAINNLHWIQAIGGPSTRRGDAVPTILDTGEAYTSQSTVTPFYDTSGGAAGTLPNGGGWFVDRPLINENEYESNPVASIQFQVVLASDTQTIDRNGVVQNDLTLYGGYWWGFTYSAYDTPEPA